VAVCFNDVGGLILLVWVRSLRISSLEKEEGRVIAKIDRNGIDDVERFDGYISTNPLKESCTKIAVDT